MRSRDVTDTMAALALVTQLGVIMFACVLVGLLGGRFLDGWLNTGPWLTIVLVLQLQFGRLTTTFMVFGGVFLAWAGGFWLIWLYGQPWFLDVGFLGVELRHLFNIHTVNLSVAVWVGFLALFGIATDDGVVMATYLDQSFRRRQPADRDGVRAAVIAGARRRVRPALMTSATTILALLPVLTLTGRGADIMIPMAIPVFGGMAMALLTLFIVPVLDAWRGGWGIGWDGVCWSRTGGRGLTGLVGGSG